MPRAVRIPIAGLATALLLAAVSPAPADAHAIRDETPRIAVVSAFAPELAILQGELEGASTHSVNGVAFTTGTLEGHDVVLFLSGISVVNAAMTVQVALTTSPSSASCSPASPAAWTPASTSATS